MFIKSRNIYIQARSESRAASKMVWSCLDFDKHDQNVSSFPHYSMSVCLCVLIILHVNKDPAVYHYYSLCQHVNIARHQSCTQHKWTELLCKKPICPAYSLPKMASYTGRSLIQRVLIGSLIDWWSPVMYWFISVPNELRVLSCPEENNHPLTEAL